MNKELKNRRVVAIVQARMGSQRLSGKSMALLAGRPLLWHVLGRIQRSRTLDQIVLATTRLPEDDVLGEIATELGIAVFRGSENDLVERYYQAALKYEASIVVRICADNPVVEPREIDRIVNFHLQGQSDFSANTHNILNNRYPDGLGAEVFDLEKLREVRAATDDPRHREHPHTYFYEHPEKFRIGTVQCPREFQRPELKLDVNTPAELTFMQEIYDYWYPRKADFHITDIIAWYDQHECANKA